MSSRGAQFSDIKPRAPFNGVDPDAPGHGLIIPPSEGMQVGQQVYLVIDIWAEVASPLFGTDAYLYSKRPLWLRPQTQFRRPGFNWPGPGGDHPPTANSPGVTYASSIYSSGVEQGADGKSFGTPPDAASLAGRLASWLDYAPLWLSANKRLDSAPGDLPPPPPGNNFSTLLDDEWVFPLTGVVGGTVIQGRKALFVPAAGIALQFADGIVPPFVPEDYPDVVAGEEDDGFHIHVQYKVGDANSVFQQDVD